MVADKIYLIDIDYSHLLNWKIFTSLLDFINFYPKLLAKKGLLPIVTYVILSNKIHFSLD